MYHGVGVEADVKGPAGPDDRDLSGPQGQKGYIGQECRG